MSSAEYAHVREHFLAVCERPKEAQLSYLEELGRTHPELRVEVESLLDIDKDLSGFLIPRPPSVPSGPCQGSPRVTGPLPERIGRYEILEVLGRGGMGMVYLARQESPDREVALKVIRPERFTVHALRRFEREARFLGRLHHPGIAQIFEADTAVAGDGVQPFYTMEYVRGAGLLEFAEEHSLGTRERLELFVQVCRAVEHAHRQGVIHRDLKPGNILVDESGQPKVLDFGLARALDSVDGSVDAQTEPGQLAGTLVYMSPEQARGELDRLDTRTDVYSLGVLGYQLLSGRLPYTFDGTSMPAVIRSILEQDPAPLRAPGMARRSDLQIIFSRTLAKDREQRYSSATDLVADIEHYLRHEPIAARPVSLLYQVSCFVRRKRGLAIGIAGSLLGLVIAVITSTFFMLEARGARDEAISERAGKEELAVFWPTLLLQANPDVHQGRTVTVQDLLDQASDSVHGSFADQPELKAQVHRDLGRIYTSTGDHERAVAHLTDALRLYTAPDSRIDALITKRTLGNALWMAGDHGEGEAMVKAAHAGLVEALGPRTVDALIATQLLGRMALKAGRFREAEALLRDAVQLSGELLGRSDGRTLRAMSDQAACLLELDRMGEAEAVLEEALPLLTETFGREHSHTLTSVNRLAQVYQRQGRLEEAEPLLSECLAVHSRVRGEEDASTLALLNNYARLIQEMGRTQEALTLLEQIYETQLRLHGESNPQTLDAMGNVGYSLALLGRWEEAEPILRDLLYLREVESGPEHLQTINTAYNLGVTFLSLGNFEEAEKCLQRVLEARLESHGPLHPIAIDAVQRLTEALRKLRRPSDAVAAYEFFFAALDGAEAAGSCETAELRRDFAPLLIQMDRFEDAEAALLAGHQTVSANPDACPGGLVASARSLMVLYEAWGRPEDADGYRAMVESR